MSLREGLNIVSGNHHHSKNMASACSEVKGEPPFMLHPILILGSFQYSIITNITIEIEIVGAIVIFNKIFRVCSKNGLEDLSKRELCADR
jgi:hypothetical protein